MLIPHGVSLDQDLLGMDFGSWHAFDPIGCKSLCVPFRALVTSFLRGICKVELQGLRSSVHRAKVIASVLKAKVQKCWVLQHLPPRGLLTMLLRAAVTRRTTGEVFLSISVNVNLLMASGKYIGLALAALPLQF